MRIETENTCSLIGRHNTAVQIRGKVYRVDRVDWRRCGLHGRHHSLVAAVRGSSADESRVDHRRAAPQNSARLLDSFDDSDRRHLPINFRSKVNKKLCRSDVN